MRGKSGEYIEEYQSMKKNSHIETRTLCYNGFNHVRCGCFFTYYKVKNQEKYMIASALHEEGVVVCIHDDYCNHVGTAEISQILWLFKGICG